MQQGPDSGPRWDRNGAESRRAPRGFENAAELVNEYLARRDVDRGRERRHVIRLSRDNEAERRFSASGGRLEEQVEIGGSFGRQIRSAWHRERRIQQSRHVDQRRTGRCDPANRCNRHIGGRNGAGVGHGHQQVVRSAEGRRLHGERQGWCRQRDQFGVGATDCTAPDVIQRYRTGNVSQTLADRRVKAVPAKAKFSEPLLNVDPGGTEVKEKAIGLVLVMAPPAKDPLTAALLTVPLTAAL